MNPYQSPKPEAREASLARIRQPRDAISRPIRLAVAVPTLIAQLYFAAMLIAWSWYWYSGSIVPNSTRDYLVYALAVVCVSGTAVVLYGLTRNRLNTAITSAAVTIVSFCFICGIDYII